jgi:hypothetical protein
MFNALGHHWGLGLCAPLYTNGSAVAYRTPIVHVPQPPPASSAFEIKIEVTFAASPLFRVLVGSQTASLVAECGKRC